MAHITASSVIQHGDDLEIVATFNDADGNAADPTTVTFTLITPEGAGTDYTAADPEVTNPQVGTYVALFVPDAAGRWFYRVHGTGGGIDSAETGAVDVEASPETSAEAYSRWGMTTAAAVALTGTAVSTIGLQHAEDEVVDSLGWRPDPDDYDPATYEPAAAFGRAVAWQAAYRASTPAEPGDGSTPITDESMTDYSVTYARPHDDAPALAPRAARLLTRYGWRRQASLTGLTRPNPTANFQTS